MPDPNRFLKGPLIEATFATTRPGPGPRRGHMGLVAHNPR
jgi:hypothetical protein